MSHCGGLVIKFVSDSCRLLCPWDSLGKNTGVGCHFLLQEISPTRESNLYLLHCKETLYLTLYFIWATGKPLCPTMISQNLWILCDITPMIILCDCKTGRLSKWIWITGDITFSSWWQKGKWERFETWKGFEVPLLDWSEPYEKCR